MKPKKRYFIRDVARLLRVNSRTILNWEEAGKIPKAARDPMSRYRVYSDGDVKRLKKITGRG